MGLEIDEMAAYIKGIPKQHFVQTATWGIQYLEMLYGLSVREDLTLEERRDRVMTAMPYIGPVSPYFIEQAASAAAGTEVTVTAEHSEEFSFDIHVAETGETVADIVRMIEAINRIKPSHLGYDITTEQELDMSLYTGFAIVEAIGVTEIAAVKRNLDNGFN